MSKTIHYTGVGSTKPYVYTDNQFLTLAKKVSKKYFPKSKITTVPGAIRSLGAQRIKK
jgi:hypothetical protein